MSDGRQRQRHGVHKRLAEGIGGLVVGAAVVLLLRGIARRRAAPAAAAPSRTEPATAPVTGGEPEVPRPPSAG